MISVADESGYLQDSASSFLRDGKNLPLPLTPLDTNLGLGDFISRNKNVLDRELFEYGGFLLRGFLLDGVEDFESAVESFRGALKNYNDGAFKWNTAICRCSTICLSPPAEAVFGQEKNGK